VRTGFLAILLLAACGGSVEDVDSSHAELNTPQCQPALACADAPLESETRAWRHSVKSKLISLQTAHHRGRDQIVNPGAAQAIRGKFAYGLVDADLEDEEVDVFVQRDCAWQKLGTSITTNDGAIEFEIPEAERLGPGMHRIRLVVAGDRTSADVIVDVVPPNTPIFVSDIDGTLTSSEHVEYVKLLTGDLPDTHPGAPEALRALAAKGFRPVYLTARPEWLAPRTHAFLDKHGFPPGIVQTSMSFTGAGIGGSAATYKKEALAGLAAKGLVPAYGFGNKSTDSDAYATIDPTDHRIFFQIDGAFTGRKIESYTELLPAFETLAPACH
jgi:phosphatidate phosphatase PAH1